MIKLIHNDIKLSVDKNGKVVATKRATPSEIAELFEVPVSEVLSGKFKLGVYKCEEN